MAKKNKWIKGDLTNFEQTTPSIEYPSLTKKDLDDLHNQFYKEVVLDPIRLIKRVARIRYPNEVRNGIMAVKHFAGFWFKNMRYVR